MGTPQMNTAEAELIDENGKTYLEFGELENKMRIALPDSKGRLPNVLAYAGKKVIFGIRPNDIHGEPELIEEFPDRVVSAIVEFVELLGAESNVFLRISGLEFASVVDSKIHMSAETQVKVAFDTEAVHLFDMDTQKTIIN
ncbi:MAG: TOBE domain-containing protein, partial [Oscillospiraceae bacterium]